MIQDVDYELKAAKFMIEDDHYVNVPKATNFFNKEKENRLNALLDSEIDRLVNKGSIESLYYNYTKKDNGLLSIVFSGSYVTEEGSISFNDVLNVDTNDMVELETEDFFKQDEASLMVINELFRAELLNKELEEVSMDNDMMVFYEQGIYAIVFLANEDDVSNTMIIFNESDIADYVNY